MLFAKDREMYKWDFRDEVSKFKRKPFEECTAEDVKEYFFGDAHGYRDSRDCDYKIVYKYSLHPERYKKKFYNRLAYPFVFLILVPFVLPVVWLFKGEWGFDNDSKFGRVIRKILGE